MHFGGLPFTEPPQVRGGIFTKVQLPGHVHLVPHGQVREGACFGDSEIRVGSASGGIYSGYM